MERKEMFLVKLMLINRIERKKSFMNHPHQVDLTCHLIEQLLINLKRERKSLNQQKSSPDLCLLSSMTDYLRLQNQGKGDRGRSSLKKIWLRK